MGLSLNIGCGEKTLKDINRHRCINVDIRSLPGVDVVCDVRALPFCDNCFEIALASDIIEHFPISEIPGILAEWARVLKISGKIAFRTPNFKWVVSSYLTTNNAKFVSYHIFGGQDYDNNFHYVLFDREWLVKLCNDAGLSEVSYKEIGSNFELVCRKEGVD